jgi:cytosine deaminase
MDNFLQAALNEAISGLSEGGIPIGSVLVHDGKIIGRGHNRRIQKGSTVLHGEMDALENAGRLNASIYRECTLYTTLSPCPMCSGAILLYKIPRVVIGENKTFLGAEQHLRENGVELTIVNDPSCIAMMENFIQSKPELWNEDIGEIDG